MSGVQECNTEPAASKAGFLPNAISCLQRTSPGDAWGKSNGDLAPSQADGVEVCVSGLSQRETMIRRMKSQAFSYIGDRAEDLVQVPPEAMLKLSQMLEEEEEPLRARSQAFHFIANSAEEEVQGTRNELAVLEVDDLFQVLDTVDPGGYFAGSPAVYASCHTDLDVPATDSITGVSATNPMSGVPVTNCITSVPATNSITGVPATYLNVPATNTITGVPVTDLDVPATNTITGVPVTDLDVPATNTITGVPATNSIPGVSVANSITGVPVTDLDVRVDGQRTEGETCHSVEGTRTRKRKSRQKRGPRKELVYERQHPFSDKMEERKRQDAIRAKRCRERNKQMNKKLLDDFRAVCEQRDDLALQLKRMQQREKAIFHYLKTKHGLDIKP